MKKPAAATLAILLYWDTGRSIVEKQQTHGWGDFVVEMVAADMQRVFSGMRGFSSFNLWRMRQFYLEYSSAELLAQLVPELPCPIPCGHYVEMMKKNR
jgi:hypothetical protein